MAEPEPGGENGEACRSESTAYVIDGGEPLRGTIPVSGAKNAVLKLMAAAVLCEDPCTISNAPRIADVEYILETLRDLGAEACWIGEHTLRIHARDL
ncbi:MAG: UDP-N-acetylglucosamine 1-carboxyvinyltransferase, partial [Chloroflexi bacterium]|nr:UDP-N-acetylglucosamine 1-carboxyvinyltransferase [Chloroflexota bacterium]